MARFHAQNPQRGFSLAPIGGIVTWLSLLSFVLFLVMAMEDVTDSKETAKLAEAKQNLHDIQLSVERFCVDNKIYPDYLIGGNRFVTTQIDESVERPFTELRVIDDLTQLPDPLVRTGYLIYPRNPFIKGDQAACLAVHHMQLSIPGSGAADPLRNGDGGIGIHGGTRFGSGCSAMGQVLADPRYPQISYTPDELVGGGPYPSYADVGYPFWDIYSGDKPKPYLPGEFFYKSNGAALCVDAAASATGPVQPLKTGSDISYDGYIMGLYGPLTDKGKDIIGAERQVTGWTKGADGKLVRDPAGIQVWPWTRSTTSSEQYDGSPYMSGTASDAYQWSYGNPNGVRDALALVLTAGPDVE
jgi:hypothetical protein